MKAENKCTIQEVHEMLEKRAGRAVSSKDLGTLLHCWRKARGYKSRGRQGWLSAKDTRDFLAYAY